MYNLNIHILTLMSKYATMYQREDNLEYVKEILDYMMIRKEEALQLQKQYEEEISQLPKGNIILRNTGGKKKYYYLNYYCAETKKNLQKYIGNDESVATMKTQTEKRRALEKSLIELTKELDVIEKMLKPAQKHIEQGNKTLPITKEKSSTRNQLR